MPSPKPPRITKHCYHQLIQRYATCYFHAAINAFLNAPYGRFLAYEALQLYKQDELYPNMRAKFGTFDPTFFTTCKPFQTRYDFFRFLEAGLCHLTRFEIHEDFIPYMIRQLSKHDIETVKYDGGFSFFSFIYIFWRSSTQTMRVRWKMITIRYLMMHYKRLTPFGYLSMP